ncbi:MAG: hypothetical protein OXL96_07785 [Candidatus Poribacteria bacterium]|nr:hypothetical protein [Candidatus Poribacteria bacterium]
MLIEGQQTYTPTRLEWLALELNAENQISTPFLDGLLLTYIAYPKDNTICIGINYPPNVQRERVDEVREVARETVMKRAKRYNWDSWLKIEEKIQQREKEYSLQMIST